MREASERQDEGAQQGRWAIVPFEAYREIGQAVLALVEIVSACDMMTAARIRRLKQAWERVQAEVK